MGAEVQDGVRGEVLAQIAVERRKGVRWRKAAFEEQPHRIALVSEAWLQPNEDIAKLRAQHKDRVSVAEGLARRGSPLSFDLRKVTLATQMIVQQNALVDIGVGSKARGIALGQTQSKLVAGRGNVDTIAAVAKRDERVVQGGKYTER